MRLKFIFALFLLIQTSWISARTQSPQYIYVSQSYSVGMFAEFSFITGLLFEYDTHPDYIKGFEVDFKTTGLYYDPAYGPNWWNYFCEPICLGSREGCQVREFLSKDYRFDFKYAYFAMDELGRDRAFDLIQKYIKVRKPILDKVDSFVQENFTSNHIIGVHYRGTDKKKETYLFPYKEIVARVNDYISEHVLTDYKIFVASDEQPFVDYMEQSFPGSVLTYDIQRSNDSLPLHEKKFRNQYSCGESAIIDCLLLSRGDVLIRTSSNLSLWSSFFNPTIPVILIEKIVNHPQTPPFGKKAKKRKKRNIMYRRFLSIYLRLLHVVVFMFLCVQSEKISAKTSYSPPTYIYVSECFNWGMFAEFLYIAGVLFEYDNHPEKYAGIKIDFNASGLYYDPEYGPNWWNYFCDPICLGDPAGATIWKIDTNSGGGALLHDLRKMDQPRLRAFEIIQKYIKIRQHILDKIELFVQENFCGDRVIAVHYRGTDKKSETPRVPYEKVVAKVGQYIKKNLLTDYTIFVASDEQPFVDFMESRFPGFVVSYDVKRSSDDLPLHEKKFVHQYHSGEAAIIDCLLLSRGDVLFRTPSQLSLWSSYFNPTMPVVLVNGQMTKIFPNTKIKKHKKKHF